ncbi:hypothetical protein N7466_005309 [Penicillium verhagenii]|uniref:uncharacterized protein n=1 Tax=Penicillium verhagenii TaxID=1562060 RepID=UPI0025457718|nr:uncharacterized protein N7466_005309 [Penicillium verhagenii]KAJ5935762.1 hypothetical protein N7466_005309 [Penicillium verhagenii]
MSPLSSLPTREIAGITIPDTPLVNKSIAYVRDQVDNFTYNHVMRSFLFAITSVPIATAVAPGYPIDYEVIAISTLLHDLAWAVSSDKCTPDKRFEVDSANAAREFLVTTTRDDASWSDNRVQLVWDAIALHTTNSIAMHKQPEVMLAHVGGAGPLTSKIFNDIVSVFPRENFQDGVRRIMCDLCKIKPQTTYDNFVAEYGEKYVEGYDRTGKKTVDFLESGI